MIAAVYLVCATELGGCVFFVDQPPYATIEECDKSARETIANNAMKAEEGLMIKHEATYVCVSMQKA